MISNTCLKFKKFADAIYGTKKQIREVVNAKAAFLCNVLQEKKSKLLEAPKNSTICSSFLTLSRSIAGPVRLNPSRPLLGHKLDKIRSGPPSNSSIFYGA